MKKLRSVYLYAKEKYALLALKKYTTIAGTLVFFLIMSIVPFSFWISLLIGKLPVDTEKILSLPVFDSVKNVLLYIQKEAENATASASIILVFTTLYSATNLFYQMRKSGEIIYDYRRETQGIRLRIGALILLIVVMASVVVFLLLFGLGSFLFSQLLTKAWEIVADYLLLAIIAFFLVLILNVYICPHKTSVKNFLSGTFLTVGLWTVAIVGFSVYLKIGNMGRLYGALSAIIVFLLWLYILMICFIVGVIFNSERVMQAIKKNKKAKPHKKKKTRQTILDEKD
ncbi:MAG: YihY/virulence factor BrkB family protein [Clostridia bacterium]|nr:YihY/virulence factor BrkB family protein [Clostridia bacterium]